MSLRKLIHSYYASTVFPGRAILTSRPVKRQRLITPQHMRQNLASSQRLHASQQIFLPANVITNSCAPLFPIDVPCAEQRSHLNDATAAANGMQQQSHQQQLQHQPNNTYGALKLYSEYETYCTEPINSISESMCH